MLRNDIYIPAPDFTWFHTSGKTAGSDPGLSDGIMGTSTPIYDLPVMVDSTITLGVLIAAAAIVGGLLMVGAARLVKSSKASTFLKRVGSGMLGACLLGSLWNASTWGTTSLVPRSPLHDVNITAWKVTTTVPDEINQYDFNYEFTRDYSEPSFCAYDPKDIRCGYDPQYEDDPQIINYITNTTTTNVYEAAPTPTPGSGNPSKKPDKPTATEVFFNADGM